MIFVKRGLKIIQIDKNYNESGPNFWFISDQSEYNYSISIRQEVQKHIFLLKLAEYVYILLVINHFISTILLYFDYSLLNVTEVTEQSNFNSVKNCHPIFISKK